MTSKGSLGAGLPLNKEERRRWLIRLGGQMTIAARAGYPVAKQADSIPHVMAFNELQHQLYNYLGRSQTKDDWTIEELLEGLYQKASASGVADHFGAALNSSLRADSGVTSPLPSLLPDRGKRRAHLRAERLLHSGGHLS